MFFLLQYPATSISYHPFTIFRRYFYVVLPFFQPNIFKDTHFYTIRLHFFYYLSVYLQSYFCTIRKYLYLCHWFYAVHATATGNINHRFRIPVCFIKIKCILFNFTVMRHQSFIIDTRTIPFCTMSCSEIKHIPNKTAPNVWTFTNNLPILNMIFRLPVFRMPPTSRAGLYQ